MTSQPPEAPTDAEVAAAVQMLKLLADPTRLRIVWALLHGEHAVGDLAAHVGAHVPAVSQHLAKLRLAKVVRARRDGNQLYYRVHSEHIERLAFEAFSQIGHEPPTGSARGHADRPAAASGQ